MSRAEVIEEQESLRERIEMSGADEAARSSELLRHWAGRHGEIGYPEMQRPNSVQRWLRAAVLDMGSRIVAASRGGHEAAQAELEAICGLGPADG